MTFDWQTGMLFAEGLWVTLKLLVISLSIGAILACVIALMRVSTKWWLNGPAFVYTYVLRGTPVLVQLFLVYYGFAQFDVVTQGWMWRYLQDPTFCAALTLILNTSAYSGEIFAGTIKMTHPGELDAARAYGMSKWLAYRRVIIPAAARRALPQYSSEVIMMLHTTSLASIVTLADITGTARDIYGETFAPFAPFLTAAGLYLALTFILVQLFRRLETRWLSYMTIRKV